MYWGIKSETILRRVLHAPKSKIFRVYNYSSHIKQIATNFTYAIL